MGGRKRSECIGKFLWWKVSNPWWEEGREVSVLESFCGLEMCADVKDCLLVKSLAFENSSIQEVYFFVLDFSRKFNCRVVTVC